MQFISNLLEIIVMFFFQSTNHIKWRMIAMQLFGLSCPEMLLSTFQGFNERILYRKFLLCYSEKKSSKGISTV